MEAPTCTCSWWRRLPEHVVGGAAGESLVHFELVDEDAELREAHDGVELTAPRQLVGRDATHLATLHLRRVRVHEVDCQQIQSLRV